MYDPRLNSFIQTADQGSFSKAADALYISSTAIIKQINSLEQDLGTQLFFRTPQGLFLTAGGKSFYQDAQFMVRYWEESKHRAKAAMKQHPDTIRIGASFLTPISFLTKHWKSIRQISPTLELQLINFENSPENAAAVLNNLGKSIDVVPEIFDQNLLDAHGCRALTLSMLPICCAMPIDHPLSEKEYLSVEDLHGQAFLMLKKGRNQYADQIRNDLEQHHPQIRILDFPFYCMDVFNQCENDHCLLMAVESWQFVHPLLKFVPVKWPYRIPFGFLYAAEPSETVRMFLEAAKQVFPANP